MGGNDERRNLIYVRVRVHFLLHVILAKAVKPQYRKRACWCVVCFSANNEKQLVRKKLKSTFVQRVREEHYANLKTLRWYHNCTDSIRLFPEEHVPHGYTLGRLKLPSRAGAKYITDGTQTKRLKDGQLLPEGWVYGQKPERVKQISELGKKHQMGSGTGRLWVNNGSENKYIFENRGIPDGWVRGRLKSGKFNPSHMGKNSAGANNPNHSGLSDEQILQHAVLFFNVHNHLKANSWRSYCKENGVPQNIVKSRFSEFGGGFGGLKTALLTHVAQSPV